ncbi:MAG TPA: hypothetical protein VIG32_09785 [Candidatus Baltobacteraceae bacterium]|jgi:hypothetical protein
MKHHHRLVAVAALAILALAGCGGSASGDLASFKAPDGWRGGGIGGYSMWISPDAKNGSGEVLMLMRLPYRSGSHQDLSMATSQYQHAKVLQRKTIDICGKQPANYVEMAADQKTGKHENVQLVSTRYNDTVYFAMYARDAGTPANPAANTAIRSLCLKH